MSALGGQYVEQNFAVHRCRRSTGAVCAARCRLRRRRRRIARRIWTRPDRCSAGANGNDILATVQHAGAIANANGNADRNAAADGHSVTDTFPDTYGFADSDAVPNPNASSDLGLTMALLRAPLSANQGFTLAAIGSACLRMDIRNAPTIPPG